MNVQNQDYLQGKTTDFILPVLFCVTVTLLAALASGCNGVIPASSSLPTSTITARPNQAITAAPVYVPTYMTVPPIQKTLSARMQPYKKSVVFNNSTGLNNMPGGTSQNQTPYAKVVPYLSKYTYIPPAAAQVPQTYSYNPSTSIWVRAVQNAQLEYQISSALRNAQYASPNGMGSYMYTSPLVVRQPMFFQGPGIPYANPNYIPPITSRTIPGSGYTNPITMPRIYNPPVYNPPPRIYNPPVYNPPVYIPPPSLHFP